MIELKPCPFCGGEPYFRTPLHKRAEYIMMIECKRCGANPYAIFVSEVYDEEYRKEAVAEFWNRRDYNETD